MKGVLENLMGVREFRERSAGRELCARKAEHREAEGIEARKRKDLAEYRLRRKKKEETLYRRVMNRPIQAKDLEDLRLRVRFLREEEIALGERLLEAEKARREAGEKVERARDLYFLSVREKQKIEEHRNVARDEGAREIERLEEKELEEYGKALSGFGSEEENDEDI